MLNKTLYLLDNIFCEWPLYQSFGGAFIVCMLLENMRAFCWDIWYEPHVWHAHRSRWVH